MHHAEVTEAVRRRVAEVFSHLGVAADMELRESILIRDGSYCGRRFESSWGHAIWFVEENQLKFYNAEGGVLRVVEPAILEPLPIRIAA